MNEKGFQVPVMSDPDAESVYAVFEAKQELTADYIRYAGEKAASVRRLHRTSLSAETIDGPSRAKPLHHILAGILTLSAGWKPRTSRSGSTTGHRIESHIVPGSLIGRSRSEMQSCRSR